MRWMAEDIDPPQFKWELEMKKLNVKKSRLVELNRGRLDLSLGAHTDDCNGTLSMNLLCQATKTFTGLCLGAIAVDPYSRRVAAPAG
jgi:hypothetical protein